jgi:hypothetical protein
MYGLIQDRYMFGLMAHAWAMEGGMLQQAMLLIGDVVATKTCLPEYQAIRLTRERNYVVSR